jgi:hypothetical protein
MSTVPRDLQISSGRQELIRLKDLHDPQIYDFEGDLDTELEYDEMKRLLLERHPELDCHPPQVEERGPTRGEHLAWLRYLENMKHRHHSRICPRCGMLGSGPHPKWVLNAQRRRYEPYYSYAHSVKVEGKYKVKWHYIGKLGK